MKIGILTFHCAHNYGAVLQCYALQETLKKMGHDVWIIDYRPKYLLDPYRIFYFRRLLSKNPLKIVRNSVCELLLVTMRKKRFLAFNRFINSRLRLTERVKGKNIPQGFDAYIMGSDQIWNPKITDGFDPVYFGSFGFDKGCRRYVSYAASMEAINLDDVACAFYEKALKNFDSISFRETSLASLLQPLTTTKIETVLDPALLVDRNIWNKIAIKPKITAKYVLVYQVRPDKNIRRIAALVAKEIGACVVEIAAELSVCFRKDRLQGESPESFLGWIKYAAFVVTTSFHGTAFSIIFNNPFYTVSLEDGRDGRSMSLLRDIGLSERMIDKDCCPSFSEVDYTTPNDNIRLLREQSMNFLKKSLQ